MKTQKSTKWVAPRIKLSIESDIGNGQVLDTFIEMEGVLCVAGANRDEFVQKLKNLISEYEI